MKLFQVHTGFYDPNISNGFYEGHTNIFVCAKNEKEARMKVKLKKEPRAAYACLFLTRTSVCLL